MDVEPLVEPVPLASFVVVVHVFVHQIVVEENVVMMVVEGTLVEFVPHHKLVSTDSALEHQLVTVPEELAAPTVLVEVVVLVLWVKDVGRENVNAITIVKKEIVELHFNLTVPTLVCVLKGLVVVVPLDFLVEPMEDVLLKQVAMLPSLLSTVEHEGLSLSQQMWPSLHKLLRTLPL